MTNISDKEYKEFLGLLTDDHLMMTYGNDKTKNHLISQELEKRRQLKERNTNLIDFESHKRVKEVFNL